MWEVRFDPGPCEAAFGRPPALGPGSRSAASGPLSAASLAGVPPLLACTEWGVVGHASPSSGDSVGEGRDRGLRPVAPREFGAVCAMDAAGDDLVWCTDGECLVYMRRGI